MKYNVKYNVKTLMKTFNSLNTDAVRSVVRWPRRVELCVQVAAQQFRLLGAAQDDCREQHMPRQPHETPRRAVGAEGTAQAAEPSSSRWPFTQKSKEIHFENPLNHILSIILYDLYTIIYTI